MNASSHSSTGRPSAAALRAVHVGLREDLEVSRHVFRGEPSYIVRDPMTFQSQRLALAEYAIFVGIHSGRSLGATFDDLVERRKLAAEDEDRFYQFVAGLHQLGFLRLPISDHKLLYRRYQLRERAKQREKWLGFLFLRIPVWNPDAFLNRTIHLVRPLFGRGFFPVWLVLMVSAGIVAASRWGELTQPLEGVLVSGNILLLWVTLIVLKAVHEMGHAYACKHYGGDVPEMGVYLILFTPCAYMDATASWGFPRKRERLMVCLGGMYVESIIAALAVFVWATTEPSVVHAIAYNVMFLAGMVTVLFNINPLMRYDGYYLLSDWLEIPNLRARSSRHVLSVLKRFVLGVKTGGEAKGWRLGAILFAYGAAASVYRIVLLLALVAILASKMLIAGIGLGAAYLGIVFLTTVRKLTRYLWHAEETAAQRWRAAAVGVTVLLAAPAAALWVPVPSHVYAAAVLGREHETVLRATSAGFLERTEVEVGQMVGAGELIVELSSDAEQETAVQAGAALRASEIRRDALLVRDAARSLEQASEAKAHAAAAAKCEAKLAQLKIRAQAAGRIVQCPKNSEVGTFWAEGSPVAEMVSGRWHARSIFTEEQMGRSAARVGGLVQFRAAAMPSRTIEGRITRIAPAASRTIELRPLTHLGGGDIAVDPATHGASQPYFEVTVELADEWASDLHLGMTGQVRLPAASEPIGKGLGRRLHRFWNRLMEG